MNYTDKFLEAYKALELELRSTTSYQYVFEYEQSLIVPTDITRVEKLKLCRLIRNFLVHNESIGFVEPTKAMVDFLNEQRKIVHSSADLVSKHTAKEETLDCAKKVSIKKILEQVSTSKIHLIPVVNNNSLIGVITPLMATTAYYKANCSASKNFFEFTTEKDLKISLKPFVFANPDDLYSDFKGKKVIVVDESDNYIGFLKK